MAEYGENGFYQKTPEERRFAALVEQETREILARLEENKNLELLNAGPEEIPVIESAFRRLSSSAAADAAHQAKKIFRAERGGQIEKKTGLYRPEAFEELYILSVNYLEEGKKSALIAIDLDKFKNVNSTKGQDAGDALLASVGAKIRTLLNPSDYGCRFGGDEFLILINDLPESFDIRKIVSRLAKAIADINPEDSGGPMSISAGCIMIRKDAIPYFSDAQRAANEGAGVSKKLGRGRLSLIDGDTYTAFVRDTETGTYPDPGNDKKEKGSIKEFKATREQCDREVDVSLQRITEEIELHFGDSLSEVLMGEYGVEDLGLLSKYQLGGLLHAVRSEI